jgi:hypothetical protein
MSTIRLESSPIRMERRIDRPAALPLRYGVAVEPQEIIEAAGKTLAEFADEPSRSCCSARAHEAMRDRTATTTSWWWSET